MLEERAAGRLMRTAHKVVRPVHFDRYLLPIVESNERVDAVPGDLATRLFFHMGNARARTDFPYNIGLQLRGLPFLFDESVAAGMS